MFKTITWLLLSRLQGNRPHQTGTLWNLPQPTPARTGTLRNPPEPSGTYLRNLRQYTSTPLNPLEPSETLRNLPEPTGTFRNLPLEPTPAHTGTLRNLPERASGTYTSTHRNSPEPAFGTYTSTHQNSPEPSSGTCSCDPHRHTPELIWAEEPTSSRCWGKTLLFSVSQNRSSTPESQAHHHAFHGSARSATALVRRSLTGPFQGQVGHLHPRVIDLCGVVVPFMAMSRILDVHGFSTSVRFPKIKTPNNLLRSFSHLLFIHSQIDDRTDIGQGQRAFGHVGRQHEMAATSLRRLEDLQLVLKRANQTTESDLKEVNFFIGTKREFWTTQVREIQKYIILYCKIQSVKGWL